MTDSDADPRNREQHLEGVRVYFDREVRKHPSLLLYDTGPTNFLVPSESYGRELLGTLDRGQKILEVGSGDSVDSITLAATSNRVWAIDISPRRLRDARLNILRAGKADSILPLCMDAHKLGFRDACFDLVVGNSVLLFLDKKEFMAECRRVLKPGGRALFSNESMAGHPVLVLRRLLPRVRARETVARRVTVEEIETLGRQFGEVVHKQFYLLSVLWAPLLTRWGRLQPVHWVGRAAWRMDEWLLAAFPVLRRYAWISVIEFRKPRA